MNEHYYEEMVRSITSVTDRNQKISLKYTGLNKEGGSTLAYEFEGTENQVRYFLKITPNEDNGGGELRVLPKVNQVFKNEILSEPDSLKRLGYLPVPTIIADDPARFNPEFSKLFKDSECLLQMQTAALGQVRMGIGVVGRAMRGPAGMADADGALDGAAAVDDAA